MNGHSIAPKPLAGGERPPRVVLGLSGGARRRFFRYVLVGGTNTVFAYCCYASLTYLLSGISPFGILLAGAASSVVNITMAYVGYKFVVFKTKGNYIQEYLRCFVTYGVAALMNLAALPFAVKLIELVLTRKQYAPYLAGAVLMCGNAVFSFLGHSKYSFRR
jgi:putative flippase GtrA